MGGQKELLGLLHQQQVPARPCINAMDFVPRHKEPRAENIRERRITLRCWIEYLEGLGAEVVLNIRMFGSVVYRVTVIGNTAGQRIPEGEERRERLDS